jgi:hypothetical protein
MKAARALASWVLLWGLLSFQAANAAITLDNSAHGATTGGTKTSLTWTHTVGSGSNRILIVGVSLKTRSVSLGSVTYAGTALSKIGAVSTGSNDNRTEMWYLLAPTPTVNGAVVVTMTASQSTAIAGGSLSYTGVKQSAPAGFTSNSGNSATPSVVVANATGDVVIDTATANGDAGTLTPNAAQTQRWNLFSGSSGDGNEIISGGSTKAGAASTTMSWTVSGGNKPWTIAAVPLAPAAPAFINLQSVQVTSDPVNGATSPKYIPGAFALYTTQITNTGDASPDTNTVSITDAVPAHTVLYVGDLSGAGSGPIQFANGSPSSGLTYTFTSLSSTTDNVDFSNDGGATYTYTPTPDANGFDANVTNIRISPQGVFAATGGGNPSLQISYRVRVN